MRTKHFKKATLLRSIKSVIRAGLLTASALGLFGCKPAETEGPAPAAPKISEGKIIFATNAPQLSYLVIEPAQERTAAALGLYGRLAWDEDATVRIYSPAAGRVVKLPVSVNDPVTAGEALAELDSPDFGQALADARTAQGNFAAAEKTFLRTKELLAHGAAAQKDVEAAEAAEIAARAEINRAAAKLKNFGGTLDGTNSLYELRSPLAGVLVEKNISPGQEIRSDLMLANATPFTNPQFVVTDPARLWLFLDVDDLTVTSLTPGQEISIHTAAYPDKIFTGKLESIGRELDPTTRTIKARGLVDNGEKLLRAEMYVTADVTSTNGAVVDVPTKSVFSKDKEHFVFIESAPGQFERRAVSLGAEGNGRTAILSGLEKNQRVVTEGCLLLESIFEGDNS